MDQQNSFEQQKQYEEQERITDINNLKSTQQSLSKQASNFFKQQKQKKLNISEVKNQGFQDNQDDLKNNTDNKLMEKLKKAIEYNFEQPVFMKMNSFPSKQVEQKQEKRISEMLHENMHLKQQCEDLNDKNQQLKTIVGTLAGQLTKQLQMQSQNIAQNLQSQDNNDPNLHFNGQILPNMF